MKIVGTRPEFQNNRCNTIPTIAVVLHQVDVQFSSKYNADMKPQGLRAWAVSIDVDRTLNRDNILLQESRQQPF